jgi:hypothetical protein
VTSTDNFALILSASALCGIPQTRYFVKYARHTVMNLFIEKRDFLSSAVIGDTLSANFKAALSTKHFMLKDFFLSSLLLGFRL